MLLMGFLPSAGMGQGAIQLPDVVASAGVIQRTVYLSADNPTLLREVNQLFALHGGFELVGSKRGSDFAFSFSRSASNAIRLEIESGNQTLLTQNFEGESSRIALYAAADHAVQRTLGTPGFFASTIAFISDRTGHTELYTSDLLFQSIRQLTQDRNQCLGPSISPQGDVVLYTSYHGTGFPDIYRVDLKTGRRTVFAGFKGTNTGAKFSPDARSVAMILSGSGNSELFVANSNGRQLRRLTRTESLESDPSWSPDGRRLVLTSDQMGQPQIYTIESTGRDFTRVRTDISRNCSEPVWNPRNADQIAFTAAVAGEFELCVFEFSKQKSTILSRGTGDAVHPEWLNDGRHIIYTHRTPKFSRLMILDTLTGKQMRLSPVDFNNASQASVYYSGRR